ncbi:MAG: hypothetical protein KME29_09155 [Calothrix sp. FI2-JRJ7]|jgi:hypothetical protein|nr:hypothetical protein [Calothrix sp. FI2-JRJ7]
MKLNIKLITLSLAISLLGAAPIFNLTSGMLPVVAQNQPTSTNTKFQTFVEKGRYSIQYPQNWFIRRESKDLLFISNRKIPVVGGGAFPNYFIKTDVQIENGSLQEKISTLDSNREPGERLVKKRNVKVDGKNAVRLWYSGGETEMILTLLPYKQTKTVSIVSFYTTNNAKLVPTLERIHSSFKSLK